MAAINTSILTVIVGMLGILLGTLISPFINHRLTENSKRKEILFNKKLEYFERVTNTIEDNLKIYKRTIEKIEETNSRKEFEKIQSELKQSRKKFQIMASPLYLNIKRISFLIELFVRDEGDIFQVISNLKEIHKESQKIKIINDLNINLIQLQKTGEAIINEMKKELKR